MELAWRKHEARLWKEIGKVQFGDFIIYVRVLCLPVFCVYPCFVAQYTRVLWHTKHGHKVCLS
jgi:hypothetical protein